uniref:GH20759p n=1 Tax=Drosophila melanogaster TaxID=7227 RepID=Q95SJ8_DROME|nr:GH20759p [Drosophila melanogaster]
MASRRPTTSWTISRRTLWSRACKCFFLTQGHPKNKKQKKKNTAQAPHTPHSIKISIEGSRIDWMLYRFKCKKDKIEKQDEELYR